jgi:hypothetical protein
MKREAARDRSVCGRAVRPEYKFGGECVMMFSRIETDRFHEILGNDCPTVEEIGGRFRAVAGFYSIFFELIGNFPAGGRTADVLAELLRSEELAKAVPQLLPFNPSAARDCTELNRYEFEGSLVGALLQGTCTDQVVSGEREAYEAARATMREAVLRPNGGVGAFRMDDPRWSALTNQATLWWAYFVFESSRSVCWFVCFADPY